MEQKRTNWAEEFAERFVSRPLVHECVFRSARYLGTTEKEVCDLLLVLRNQAILVQMKCQEEPASRDGDKLERWVIKQARRGLAQVSGAAKTISDRDIWCQHSRRGRVDFKEGQLNLLHGIVLVEHFSKRIVLPDCFELADGPLPISFFTTNDFLNVVDQLRAFPEIVHYLRERHRLPDESLRGIGGERAFFEHYILNKGSFEGWTTYSEVEDGLRKHKAEIRASLKAKTLADRDAMLIEHVSDQLSQRGSDPRTDLPVSLAAHVDPPDKRSGYLRMQEHLCDLPLSERRALGTLFEGVCNKLDRGQQDGFTFAAGWVDSKPGFIFVFGSSHKVQRGEVQKRTCGLLRAALTHYSKAAGMAITDRDGESFEVALFEGFVPGHTDHVLAEEFFGRLKTFEVPTSLVPGRQ